MISSSRSSIYLPHSPGEYIIREDSAISNIEFKQQTLYLLQSWIDGDAEGLTGLNRWASHSVTVAKQGVGNHYDDDVLLTSSRRHHEWLTRHGLLPLFAGLVNTRQSANPHPEIRISTNEVWRNRRLSCISRFVRLDAVAGVITEALDTWGGPWTTIKGFSLARRVYDQPSMRLTGDIDILVLPQHLCEALDVLYSINGRKKPPLQRSHEECVNIQGIFIDLHLAPVRIGRLRCNPTEEWLSRTRREGNYPCLSEHDELVLSFFHPAVTDYLTAKTIRLLDIVLQVKRNREAIDWQRIAEDVCRLGLANAAYATAICVNHLFSYKNGAVVPWHFIDNLKVDRFRQRYWQFWLNRQPDRLFASNPLMAQALFNLWLNDSPLDWVRAINDRRRTFRQSSSH